MTRDEIMTIAKSIWSAGDAYIGPGIESLERFFHAAYAAGAAAERKECAKIAQQTICDTHIPTGVHIYGSRVAAAIRARGEA
jgi:hypothetical protein